MNIQGMLPLISAPLHSQTASANSTSGTGSSGGSTNGTSSSNLQTMFLNLLVTELQNQDPTQPVDPTQMVGQMISLNELDQLISINQILSGLGAPPSGGGSNAAQSAEPSKSGAHNLGLSTLARATEPLAFQAFPANANSPDSLMSLYNLYGNIGALATGSNHFTTYGGK